MVLTPRQTGEFIASKSKHVFYNEQKCQELSDVILNHFKNRPINSWYHQLHPDSSHPDAIDWIFTLDLLNFSFWPASGQAKFNVDYQGKTHTGYFALCAVIMKGIEENRITPQVTSIAKLGDSEIKELFTGNDNVEMPLLQERIDSIRNAAKVLEEKFNGTFRSCLDECSGSAVKLLDIIVSNFETFRDIGRYDDQEVSFYKRAQILVADICLCFNCQSPGNLQDWDQLTAFADYRVPQVLAHFGVITYSDDLKDILMRKEEIPSQTPMEMEIRGLTIFACEKLKDFVNERLTDGLHCNSVNIDNFLWDYRREVAEDIEKSIDMHRTRCIYY